MPGKPKTEAPPPSMADVIRQRAYQMWGVTEEEPPKKSPRKAAGSKAKAKPKTSAKAAKKTGKAKASK